MTKWELFTKVAKAIHGMVNPSEGEIYSMIEDSLDGAYCPTCGSCGETGCCSPDRCNEVICLYGETNLKDYKELLEENEALRNKVKELSEPLMKYYRVIHTKSSDVSGWCSENNKSFAPNKRHHFIEISKYQFDIESGHRHKLQTVYEGKEECKFCKGEKILNIQIDGEHEMIRGCFCVGNELEVLKLIVSSVFDSGRMAGIMQHEEAIRKNIEESEDKITETYKKTFTWGELADKNTQEYDPSGYPKL